MNILLIWLIAYLVPAIFADVLIALFPERKSALHKRNALIMHTALVISTLASQYAIYAQGYAFPWEFNASIWLYVIATFLSFSLIGTLGVWYGLSALIQESSMLSISFLLLSVFPLYVVLIFVVPVFVFSHPLRAKHWVVRLCVISVWGIMSVSLFSIIHNIWIIAALHTIAGALLIKRSVLYPTRRLSRKHV